MANVGRDHFVGRQFATKTKSVGSTGVGLKVGGGGEQTPRRPPKTPETPHKRHKRPPFPLTAQNFALFLTPTAKFVLSSLSKGLLVGFCLFVFLRDKEKKHGHTSPDAARPAWRVLPSAPTGPYISNRDAGICMIWHKHFHNAASFLVENSCVAPGSMARAAAQWTNNNHDA